MKRILTAALLSSGLLFAAGAAPASADSSYGRGGDVTRDGGARTGDFRNSDSRPGDSRNGGYRDGGYRDGGPRRFDDGDRGRFGHRHFGPRFTWERVCERNRWGIKRCALVRVALPRWY